MGFQRIRSESVVQQIINAFADEIMAGTLRPGDKIPTEMELAEKFGVGRNSVREAVKILVYMGVLEIRRAEGTFICEGFSESMIDPMVFGIILGNSDSTENLMELREIMEVGVLQLASRNAEEKELRDLQRKLRLLREEIEQGPDNYENAFDADNQFHRKISEMGHNPLVTKLEDVVRVLTYSMRYDTVKRMIESGRGAELFEAHERLYRLVEHRETLEMNETVRGTYFDQIGILESDPS